jgi:hypothetical protein
VVYAFGNLAGEAGAASAVLAVLDPRRGEPATQQTLREAGGHNWEVFDAALNGDENRLVASYHGGCQPPAVSVCTTGAGCLRVKTGNAAALHRAGRDKPRLSRRGSWHDRSLSRWPRRDHRRRARYQRRRQRANTKTLEHRHRPQPPHAAGVRWWLAARARHRAVYVQRWPQHHRPRQRSHAGTQLPGRERTARSRSSSEYFLGLAIAGASPSPRTEPGVGASKKARVLQDDRRCRSTTTSI